MHLCVAPAGLRLARSAAARWWAWARRRSGSTRTATAPPSWTRRRFRSRRAVAPAARPPASAACCAERGVCTCARHPHIRARCRGGLRPGRASSTRPPPTTHGSPVPTADEQAPPGARRRSAAPSCQRASTLEEKLSEAGFERVSGITRGADGVGVQLWARRRRPPAAPRIEATHRASKRRPAHRSDAPRIEASHCVTAHRSIAPRERASKHRTAQRIKCAVAN